MNNCKSIFINALPLLGCDDCYNFMNVNNISDSVDVHGRVIE